MMECKHETSEIAGSTRIGFESHMIIVKQLTALQSELAAEKAKREQANARIAELEQQSQVINLNLNAYMRNCRQKNS